MRSRLLPRVALLLGCVVAGSDLAAQEVYEGLSLRFAFSGVADSGEELTNTGHAVTSVHCSNFSTQTQSVIVRVTDFSGFPYEASAVLSPSWTRTFSTRGTALFFDDDLFGDTGTPRLDQGAGYVFTNSADVLCTAVVVDPENAKPEYMVRLPLREFEPPVFIDGFESGDTSAW